MPDQNSPLKKSQLEQAHLFKGVEYESIIGLLEDCPVHELQQEDILLNRGESNHLLFVILSGHLRVHLELSVDPVTVLGPGEVVGELSLIDGQPTSAYVVADDHCPVLALNEKTLWSLVEASHIVARNMLFPVEASAPWRLHNLDQSTTAAGIRPLRGDRCPHGSV